MSERRCPLCDQDWEGTTCPVHGVPTIGSAQGPIRRLEIGTVLVGRFRLDRFLGQGGMGALLLAADLDTGDRVVVKVLRGERVSEVGNVRRFYQEARAVRALSHPNIVEVLMFGVDEATRAPFMAMEFVPGRTLKALVAEDGPLTEALAAQIFLPIARALAVAHRAQVLHRDLKPSNIMVDLTGFGPAVKVLDFGLAKILEDDATAPLTQPGKTVGTPAFMSPEQVTQRPQDFRTDLYGLGCVLHAALTGGPPFTGSDLIEVMRKQMRNPAPPLPPVLADGRPPSAGVRALHEQLLAKNPVDRPVSTEAVVRALLEIRDQAGGMPEGARARFEQQPTQVDLGPTTRGHHPVIVETASSGEQPTEAHLISNEPEPTARLALDDRGESTVTSIMPPTFGPTERFESQTPLQVTAELAEPSPAESLPHRVGSRSEGSLGIRARHRLVTPPPLPPTRNSRQMMWLASVASGVAVVIVTVIISIPAPEPPPPKPPPGAPMVSPPGVIATPREAPALTAAIEIQSLPSGAEVVVGEQWKGRTPVSVMRPAPGEKAKLLIKRQGYRALNIVLDHETRTPLVLTLEP